MQAEDPQRATRPTCAALPCSARELSVIIETGGSGLPPPPPITFTLQYNYLTHSRESLASWVLVVIYFFQVDRSILAKNPFCYWVLTWCVYYSWRHLIGFSEEAMSASHRPPRGPGLITTGRWHHRAVNGLLVWLMHRLVRSVGHAHLWHAVLE